MNWFQKLWAWVLSHRNRAEFRLLASDSGFEEYDLKVFMLHVLTNRHMYSEFRDLPELEAQAEISKLRVQMEEMSH